MVCGIKLSLRKPQRKNPKRNLHDYMISLPGKKKECYALVWHRLIFGSGGPTGIAAVRSCWKVPPCPTEPILKGSEDRHAAGPVREVFNGSVMTRLRRKSKQCMCSFFPRGGEVPWPPLHGVAHGDMLPSQCGCGQPVLPGHSYPAGGRGAGAASPSCMERGIKHPQQPPQPTHGQQQKHGEQYPSTEPG